MRTLVQKNSLWVQADRVSLSRSRVTTFSRRVQQSITQIELKLVNDFRPVLKIKTFSQTIGLKTAKMTTYHRWVQMEQLTLILKVKNRNKRLDHPALTSTPFLAKAQCWRSLESQVSKLNSPNNRFPLPVRTVRPWRTRTLCLRCRTVSSSTTQWSKFRSTRESYHYSIVWITT